MPSTINLPSDGTLVTPDRKWSSAMWAWMRDITQSFNGGSGFAPADATYFLRTADASLPNARVATNSATVTLDYTTPGQVAWTAISELKKGTVVTLTNAQFKALPTTPIQVIPAPGANLRISWFVLDLQTSFGSGAYTVSADGYLYAQYDTGETASQYIANDSAIPLTFLSDFVATTPQQTILTPYVYSEPVNAWGDLPQMNFWHVNTGIQLIGNNGGGDFTGGHAANTLRVTPYWIQTSTA